MFTPSVKYLPPVNLASLGAALVVWVLVKAIALERRVRFVLIRVKVRSILSALVVLFVQALGVLLGLLLSFMLVDRIQALGLNQSRDTSSGQSSNYLLGSAVRDFFAYCGSRSVNRRCHMEREGKVNDSQCSHTFLALVVFPSLHTGESSGTGNEIVREVTLVLPLLHLLVSVLSVAYKENPVSHRKSCGKQLPRYYGKPVLRQTGEALIARTRNNPDEFDKSLKGKRMTYPSRKAL